MYTSLCITKLAVPPCYTPNSNLFMCVLEMIFDTLFSNEPNPFLLMETDCQQTNDFWYDC